MPVKPLEIFLSAEMFRVTAHTLYAQYQRGNRKLYLVPIWVNHALACELYLKCLLAIKTPFLPQHHRLHELFEALPRPDKARVIRYYDELCITSGDHAEFANNNPDMENDLRSVLKDGSEVFARLRYAYEGIPDNVKMRAGFGLPILAVQKVILECHPEWTPLKTEPL